jgi:hypothetical protein
MLFWPPVLEHRAWGGIKGAAPCPAPKEWGKGELRRRTLNGHLERGPR